MRGILVAVSSLLLLSPPATANDGSRLSAVKQRVGREQDDAARSRAFLMRSSPVALRSYFLPDTPSREHVKTIATAVDVLINRQNDHTGAGRWRGVVIYAGSPKEVAPVMIDRKGRIGNWRLAGYHVHWGWVAKHELLGSEPEALAETLRNLADQAEKDPYSLILRQGARSSY